MVTEKELHSDLPVPPGEYLEEVLGELGMTKDELSRRMGRPATKINSIFKGFKAITPETAMQLEKVVGVPANIWLGLESEYRLALARQQEEAQLAEEVKLLTRFCYSQLTKLGMVKKLSSRREKVRELQRFFGVASLTSVSAQGVRQYQAAFRVGKSGTAPTKPHAVASWLRMGELLAEEMPCHSFDRSKLEASLDKIRAMTLQAPDEFPKALAALLAECGVALVIVPHFPGTKAHGATFWLTRNKAVFMLTIRGQWADVFWFSLFHELGHILLHGRRDVFIEDGSTSPDQEAQEEEASAFAAGQLMPPFPYKRFVEGGNFYPNTVVAFAREVGIDAGIVVGRLQHDGFLRPQWGNKLRTRYTWSQEVENEA
jgi:HTH-type transcriptional regulator/antitoxin HigA